MEHLGTSAGYILKRVKELAPDAGRKKHLAGLMVSILSAVALLSVGEARAETGKKTTLEQMDEAALLAKPSRDIMRLLDAKKLQLPSEAEIIAALSATAETGRKETLSEKVELSWDDIGTIGVVSSCHIVARTMTETLSKDKVSKDEQAIEMRVRVVRPDAEFELMDTGKILTGEAWGSTRDVAIMSALSEIAQSYEAQVFGLVIDHQNSRRSAHGEKTSAEEQQAVLDITAVDSAEYLNDVRVLSVEQRVVNGQSIFEARVEAEIALPILVPDDLK